MSKEIYAPVDGKAQKITKLYAPVNGVARSVKKAYKGVNGIARLVFEALPPMAPVFADNTWADIILACQLGIVPDTWVVGNQMPLTIGGKNYLVDIIGKNHDDYADGSGKAPLTFQLHDCYETALALSDRLDNSAGWGSSVMRITHLPAILALMPSSVRDAIREVNKLTGAGSNSTAIKTTADKLFLLSEIEIFGNNNNSKTGEGAQYAYYSAGNSRVKTLAGEASTWWTRSPYNGGTYYCRVQRGGSSDEGSGVAVNGVAFAFCF